MLTKVSTAIQMSPSVQTTSSDASAPNITTTPPEQIRNAMSTHLFEVMNRMFASP